LALGRREKKNDCGKESVQKTEVTTGKRTTRAHARKHAQMKATTGGRTTRMVKRPNLRRVRVLIIFYKWMKSPKCITIDTKVSYRSSSSCCCCFDYCVDE
jgi:hypothetical protein